MSKGLFKLNDCESKSDGFVWYIIVYVYTANFRDYEQIWHTTHFKIDRSRWLFRICISILEIVSLSALMVCNAMKWPGGAAISFFT